MPSHEHPLPQALTGHAGYLAVRLGQRAQRQFEQAILPIGLRPQTYDLLATVAEHGPLSQRDIAGTLGIEPARVVGMTDELERNGFLTRRVDPADRRRNLIALTPSGRRLVAKADRIAREVEDELLSPLTARMREDLRTAMRRVLDLS